MLRHQIIKGLTAPQSVDGVEAAVRLWEQVATEVISIVGVGGFESLYARSVFLGQATFPWFAAIALASQSTHRFAGLRMSFAAQDPTQVSSANTLLLVTFTDILASLIGEHLTTSILRSAWGSGASETAVKEFTNE